MKFRVSTPEDLEQLKELWVLAFQDEMVYVKNFFHAYGTADKIYVAEEEGVILGMTVYFSSTLLRLGKEYPFAYLYGVATHPHRQNQGIAGKLLSFVYEEMKGKGFLGVTTVPAEPSLHPFFQRNGFEEYFYQEQIILEGGQVDPEVCFVEAISSIKYKELREKYLESKGHHGLSYVTLDKEGYGYQNSLCHLGRGGLFQVSTKRHESCVMAIEWYNPQVYVVKEWVSEGEYLPSFSDIVRHMVCEIGTPEAQILEIRRPTLEKTEHTQEFGMIQWLMDPPEDWKKEEEWGYLGFAFD